MPASDHEEAVERLRQVANALAGVAACLEPDLIQRLMEETGQEMKAFAVYETRLTRGCGAGHLVVETAVKALIHLTGSPTAQPWGHEIDRLLPQLPQPHRGEIQTRLAPVGVADLQKWQEQARYERYVTPTPEVFTDIAQAACATAIYTADQFPPGLDVAAHVSKSASIIKEALAERDLYTGRHRKG